jgi:hypothetical protein
MKTRDKIHLSFKVMVKRKAKKIAKLQRKKWQGKMLKVQQSLALKMYGLIKIIKNINFLHYVNDKSYAVVYVLYTFFP